LLLHFDLLQLPRMIANGGSGQKDVADEGLVPVFAEEADGFGFGEGIEGIPLGWRDGLAAEGGVVFRPPRWMLMPNMPVSRPVPSRRTVTGARRWQMAG
jgi:hypothetical protein